MTEEMQHPIQILILSPLENLYELFGQLNNSISTYINILQKITASFYLYRCYIVFFYYLDIIINCQLS